MKVFRAIGLLLVFVLVSSAILTPVVYSGLPIVQQWPYSRVFHRVAMLMTVVGILLLRGQFEIREIRKELPWPKGWSWVGPVIFGAAAASIVSYPLFFWFVERHGFIWEDRESAETAWKIARTIPAALLISCIEETFFRWFIFCRLQRVCSVVSAAILSSTLYAFVHFISPDKRWEYPGFSWTIGFEYLGVVGERMMMPGVFEGGLGLLFVGLVLCAVYHRSGSLAWCIGLHSGWVLAVKLAGFFLEPPASFQYPAGAGRRYFLVTEPLTWVSILAVLLVLWPLLPRRKERTE